MKKIALSLLLALGLGTFQSVDAKKEHILPYPQELTATQGLFQIAAGKTVTVAGIDKCPALVRFFNEFGVKQVTFAPEAKKGDVVVNMVESIPGAYNHSLSDYADEAYTLKVTATGVEISAVTPVGVIRAAQTLTQMAEGYDEGTGVNLEGVVIKDWPAFKLRGFMHDVGRSFIEFDELKKHVNLLSRFKINTFHWHLTENLAWRFQVKAYPALTEARTMTRQEGKFYTQEQCKELVKYAAERGVVIIPEIDIPGHSKAFERALNCTMQSAEGKEALKKIFKEVVEVFDQSPYIHIGGDEVATTEKYLNEMIDHIKSTYHKKCVVWNPIRDVNVNNLHADMCQLWSSSGHAIQGKANIDCRYNYVNHFDVYADLVGIFKSTIYKEKRGTATVAGTISATWNDTKTKNDADLVKQNNFYANALASAERAWRGGGLQYIEQGGTTLPNSGEEYEEFKNWETRFLFHKAHSLKKEPIAYVKQTNVRWRITEPFPNGGNNALQLPPEKDNSEILPDVYDYEGNTYGTRIATGAGIYLRHIWHPTIPSFFKNPSENQTAYAWTYVYSPKAQNVGAQIEFYTYSRSGWEKGPDANKWDRRGSKVWLNGVEIPAPKWEQPGKEIPQDHSTEGLANENFTARPVVQLHLNAGWNKVFMRLPHVDAGGTKRDKWQFTFVFTDTKGVNAVDDLIYSPNRCLDEAAEQVAAKVSEIKLYRHSQVKNQPGYLDAKVADALDKQIAEIEKTYSQKLTETQRAEQLKTLEEALKNFKVACAKAAIIQPKVSSKTDTFFYTLSTPLRGNRFATSMGAGADMVGATTATRNAYWKFVARQDKSLDIVNIDGSYVSPNSPNNQALRTQSTSPSKGWKLSKADETGYFVIASGDAQFNQTTNAQQGYKVFNWGGGNNTNDTGCKYAIKAVSPKDLAVDPTCPQAGQNYYFINEHKKGDQYFYDNNGQVGFGAQKLDKRKNYVWTCVAAPNGHFYFKNLASGRYFSWQSLSTTAFEWALSTEQVTNKGCYRMQAVKQGGSNILVCKKGSFDQANRGGYYTDVHSSDFRFELCTNQEWDDKPVAPVNYYSSAYGKNWVRIFWKSTSTGDAAGLVAAKGSFMNRSAKSYPADLTAEDQLWSLVGTKDGFLLQNMAAGAEWALNVAGTGDGAEAKLVRKNSACKWMLVDKGGSFAIVPLKSKGMSLNSYGGAHGLLKLYNADDPGSKWQLQAGIVPAFTMQTVIEGENPYGNVRTIAGNLRFAIDGQAVVSSVYSDTEGENTYYLPADAQVELTQDAGARGFANGGLFVGNQQKEKLQFTVGDKLEKVKAVFKASLDNGMVLYFSPDAKGKPYRIPAIATAKNGDIFAISDNRPCGMDIGYGEVDMKCRISKDNGKTWSKEFFIANGVGDNHGGQVWKTGFGDAAVVADREHNELLVMMVCGKTVCHNGNYIPNNPNSNPNRVAQVRAKLDEKTGEWVWTDPVEVTETIYPLFVKNGRATVQSLFIGSGRICQSRVTKVGKYYRLYCAVWTKNGGNRVIYSDDFGTSWHILGTVDDRPGTGGDEPKCEEMPNGDVILSSRNHGRVFNIYKYTDREKGKGYWGEEQWSEGKPGGISVGNNTNGEIMLLKAIRVSDGKKVDVALQSLPFGGGRNNVGIFYKEITKDLYENVSSKATLNHNVLELAKNWKKGLQVSKVASAYSTMTLQHDYKFGFFFEEAPGEYCMVYIPLTLEQMTNGAYKLDKDAYVPTGIDEVVAEEIAQSNIIYDISGRRVMHPTKGLYIVNGKKVMMK